MPLRRQRRADDGVERRRGVEVHRHQQRRRRRQEGAVRHRLRPARQRRAPAVGPVLGDGQLVLQHRQRRSALRLDADGGRCARNRPAATTRQWGAAQDNYGKVWFQGGASGMPGYFQLPVHYGNFSVAGSVRAEPEHHLGRAGPDRRHAGRAAGASACPTARSTAPPAARATTCSAAIACPQDMVGDYFYGETVARIVRRLRPVKTDGPHADAQRVSAVGVHPLDRSAVPAGRHDDGAGRDDVHHRHVSRHHPGGDVVGTRDLPAPEDRAVPARQGRTEHGRIWRLTYEASSATARSRACSTRRRRSSSRISATRTAGGATPRSSCSCSSRTSRWCRRCRSWRRRAAPATSSRASTRCGRWKASAPSTRRSCASS